LFGLQGKLSYQMSVFNDVNKQPLDKRALHMLLWVKSCLQQLSDMLELGRHICKCKEAWW
jgi:hypothetical protein